MTPEILARTEALLGQSIVATRTARGGFTSAARGIVEFADGGTAFLKAATDDLTAGWLRDEHRVYGANELREAGFLPRLYAWQDGPRPLLVIEDLSDGKQPPPWSATGIRAVRATLDDLHRRNPPPALPALVDQAASLQGWRRVAENPTPLLRLGLCEEAWLQAALPGLVEAEASVDLDGDAPLHMDVRSDNLVIRKDRALLFDWNWACRGNPVFDTAFWLPSLALEGGPRPSEVLSGDPGVAAVVSGFFCWNASEPIGPGDPPAAVRTFQRRQGVVALAWAAAELRLSPP